MTRLSDRAKKLTPSATLSMAAKAIQLRSEGVDIISFSTGEPDFDTPSSIKEAAKRALDNGCTKYTPANGSKPLREAIARKLMRDNGLEYSPDDITVACGAKQAIANALLATVDPGDEVIVPAPYWVSYPAQVELAGGEPVYIDTTGDNLKLTPEKFMNAITDKTVAMILNSPANPSGIVYSANELKALAAVCIDRNIMVISDEIYEYLVFGDARHHSIVMVEPRMRERTIIVNGVSKGYAMTGWRLGWAAGPADVIKKMSMFASQQTTCPTSFVQEAAASALDGPMEDVNDMVEQFHKRRDHMHELLMSIPGITCTLAEGTFYLFPDMRAFIGGRLGGTTIENDLALAEVLLTEGHIATVAGTPFGAPGFLRLSFATSPKNIDEGMGRLKRILTQIDQK